DALPWSPLLLLAGIAFVRRGTWRHDREARLGLVWLLAIVGVLSCAKFKRADYLLPAYPGMAFFLGCLGEQLYRSAQPVVRRGLAAGVAVMIAAVVGVWIYLIHVEYPHLEPAREHPTFARAIREIAPAPKQVLFFRVECHPLAFHLGRPLNTFLEWENLDVWAGRPGPNYILMTPEDARDWPLHLHAGKLEEALRNTNLA